jgi:acyl-CoA reductase-like NAD-dependent aldehyde dehydrogenase
MGDIQKTVAVSRAAFAAWKQTTLKDRLTRVRRLRLNIAESLDDIVNAITAATGKTPVEAMMADILPTLDIFKYYESNAEAILAPRSVKTPFSYQHAYSYVSYKPLGVVLVIAPWNYPFQLAMVPLVSALIAGNTVILKPSEITPSLGELIGNLCGEAGFPRDVVQTVSGDGAVGAKLIDQKPDKIFFTGSAATGKKIMAQAANYLIPVDLELGGKDPMIVFEDADLERAANAAMYGAFANSGQVCVSVERLYVQDTVYDRFSAMLVDKTKSVKVGLDVNADMGAITMPRQIEIIEAQVRDAQSKGAKLRIPYKKEGDFIYPTILTDVNHAMTIMTEETFGPVLPVMPFKTEEEAIRLANDSVYGLNASVWSVDLEKAKRVASQIDTGNCAINDVLKNIGNPYLPFGGVKHSGFARYHGPEGLRTFCQQMSVMVYTGKAKTEINWFPYSKELYDQLKTFLRMIHGTIGLAEKIRAIIGAIKFFRKY